jgi:hypothetical protein
MSIPQPTATSILHSRPFSSRSHFRGLGVSGSQMHQILMQVKLVGPCFCARRNSMPSSGGKASPPVTLLPSQSQSLSSRRTQLDNALGSWNLHIRLSCPGLRLTLPVGMWPMGLWMIWADTTLRSVARRNLWKWLRAHLARKASPSLRLRDQDRRVRREA